MRITCAGSFLVVAAPHDAMISHIIPEHHLQCWLDELAFPCSNFRIATDGTERATAILNGAEGRHLTDRLINEIKEPQGLQCKSGDY
jgi:hypothetical protein